MSASRAPVDGGRCMVLLNLPIQMAAGEGFKWKSSAAETGRKGKHLAHLTCRVSCISCCLLQFKWVRLFYGPRSFDSDFAIFGVYKYVSRKYLHFPPPPKTNMTGWKIPIVFYRKYIETNGWFSREIFGLSKIWKNSPGPPSLEYHIPASLASLKLCCSRFMIISHTIHVWYI